MTLRSHSLALRVRLTRRSRPHWSSIGSLRRLRELEVARRMPDRAGSSLALRGTRLDLNITTVRYFLHWLHRARRTVVNLPLAPIRTNGPVLQWSTHGSDGRRDNAAETSSE